MQLHGALSRSHHHQLPAAYHRIFVQDLSAACKNEKITGVELERDYFLFDHACAGSGLPFEWNNFKNPYPQFPWFLAGGLHSHNVHAAMQLLQPSGIDVSTGVENREGKKGINLIKKLFEEIKHGTHSS